MKNQKGFTLIELLLVLAIIGIISAIAIPALLNQRQKAKAKATQSLVANVAGEIVRINDDLRANASAGTIPGTASVIAALMSLPNYQYPATKNPYGGVLTPYVASATNPGEVGLVGNDSYSDPATGNIAHAVTITGIYINDSGSQVSTSKVVALD
jgi:type IV pilus assembly protein PilA